MRGPTFLVHALLAWRVAGSPVRSPEVSAEHHTGDICCTTDTIIGNPIPPSTLSNLPDSSVSTSFVAQPPISSQLPSLSSGKKTTSPTTVHAPPSLGPGPGSPVVTTPQPGPPNLGPGPANPVVTAPQPDAPTVTPTTIPGEVEDPALTTSDSGGASRGGSTTAVAETSLFTTSDADSTDDTPASTKPTTGHTEDSSKPTTLPGSTTTAMATTKPEEGAVTSSMMTSEDALNPTSTTTRVPNGPIRTERPPGSFSSVTTSFPTTESGAADATSSMESPTTTHSTDTTADDTYLPQHMARVTLQPNPTHGPQNPGNDRGNGNHDDNNHDDNNHDDNNHDDGNHDDDDDDDDDHAILAPVLGGTLGSIGGIGLFGGFFWWLRWQFNHNRFPVVHYFKLFEKHPELRRKTELEDVEFVWDFLLRWNDVLKGGTGRGKFPRPGLPPVPVPPEIPTAPGEEPPKPPNDPAPGLEPIFKEPPVDPGPPSPEDPPNPPSPEDPQNPPSPEDPQNPPSPEDPQNPPNSPEDEWPEWPEEPEPPSEISPNPPNSPEDDWPEWPQDPGVEPLPEERCTTETIEIDEGGHDLPSDRCAAITHREGTIAFTLHPQQWINVRAGHRLRFQTDVQDLLIGTRNPLAFVKPQKKPTDKVPPKGAFKGFCGKPRKSRPLDKPDPYSESVGDVPPKESGDDTYAYIIQRDARIGNPRFADWSISFSIVDPPKGSTLTFLGRPYYEKPRRPGAYLPPHPKAPPEDPEKNKQYTINLAEAKQTKFRLEPGWAAIYRGDFAKITIEKNKEKPIVMDVSPGRLTTMPGRDFQHKRKRAKKGERYLAKQPTNVMNLGTKAVRIELSHGRKEHAIVDTCSGFTVHRPTRGGMIYQKKSFLQSQFDLVKALNPPIDNSPVNDPPAIPQPANPPPANPPPVQPPPVIRPPGKWPPGERPSITSHIKEPPEMTKRLSTPETTAAAVSHLIRRDDTEYTALFAFEEYPVTLETDLLAQPPPQTVEEMLTWMMDVDYQQSLRPKTPGNGSAGPPWQAPGGGQISPGQPSSTTTAIIGYTTTSTWQPEGTGTTTAIRGHTTTSTWQPEGTGTRTPVERQKQREEQALAREYDPEYEKRHEFGCYDVDDTYEIGGSILLGEYCISGLMLDPRCPYYMVHQRWCPGRQEADKLGWNVDYEAGHPQGCYSISRGIGEDFDTILGRCEAPAAKSGAYLGFCDYVKRTHRWCGDNYEYEHRSELGRRAVDATVNEKSVLTPRGGRHLPNPDTMNCKGSVRCEANETAIKFFHALERMINHIDSFLHDTADHWIMPGDHAVCVPPGSVPDSFYDFLTGYRTSGFCAFTQKDSRPVKLSWVKRGLEALKDGHCKTCGSIDASQVNLLENKDAGLGRPTPMPGILTVNYVTHRRGCLKVCNSPNKVKVEAWRVEGSSPVGPWHGGGDPTTRTTWNTTSWTISNTTARLNSNATFRTVSATATQTKSWIGLNDTSRTTFSTAVKALSTTAPIASPDRPTNSPSNTTPHDLSPRSIPYLPEAAHTEPNLTAMNCLGSSLCRSYKGHSGDPEPIRSIDVLLEATAQFLNNSHDPMIFPSKNAVCMLVAEGYPPARDPGICAFTQLRAVKPVWPDPGDATVVPLSYVWRGLLALRDGGCNKCGSIDLFEVERMMAKEDGNRRAVQGIKGILTVNYVFTRNDCHGICDSVRDGDQTRGEYGDIP